MANFFNEYAVGFFTLAGGIIGFIGNYLVMKLQAKSEKEKTKMEFEENRRSIQKEKDIEAVNLLISKIFSLEIRIKSIKL